MSEKWIRISDRLPEIEKPVWLLVKVPPYKDAWDHDIDKKGKFEVFYGIRYIDYCQGKGYSYELALPDLDSFSIRGGEEIEFDWGERNVIVAWMPVDVPKVNAGVMV